MITRPKTSDTPTAPSAPSSFASLTIAPQPAKTSANAAIASAAARRVREGRSIGPASYPLTITDSIDTYRSMAIDLELPPKQKRPAGEPCCEPVAYPDVERT